MPIPKAFYAYSSQKADLVEDIREAVYRINESGSISITTWENLTIGGKFIIKGILEAIDKCDLFICDLTYLNLMYFTNLDTLFPKRKKYG